MNRSHWLGLMITLVFITKLVEVHSFVRDGLEYSTRVAKTRECNKKCGNKRVGKGVCGSTGIRYQSVCHRTCFKAQPADDRTCDCEHDCGFLQQKVCGTDGNWHRNSCVLKCHEATETAQEVCECVDDCEKQDGLKRVCSENGTFFLNSCTLGCIGAKEMKGGRAMATCKRSATGSIPTF